MDNGNDLIAVTVTNSADCKFVPVGCLVERCTCCRIPVYHRIGKFRLFMLRILFDITYVDYESKK
jgi:hypothetical protein